ncbi:protein delta homolog 1 isoform X2 [Carassius gibelio]|uniref:protein delta homolog 1 isoform X2 n=1 Tax=Carassius gibelio TaxID=101364 RepID=UPI0022792B58|nr:protein delta homolog 1 isoform X2 [Carassius gibelio]
MNVFLRLGFSFLLLFCASVSAQGPECGAGCHQHHGFCEQSGECRCRAGWRGAVCDQCVPSPDCVHGVCEEPGQCVCERGWTGARCDREVHRCSSKLCSGNSTCVQTGRGGHVCLCSPGYTGENCQLKTGACSENGSRCQNGGSCVNTSGFDSRSSCLCAPGFTGSVCEKELDVCEPNPCVNGGRCVQRDPTYTCVCPPLFSGPVCDVSLSVCSSDRCMNGGTCSNDTLGRIRCVCPPRFTGPSCELHVSQLKPKPRARALGPGYHTAAAHTFHKLLRPSEREPLQPSGPLVTRSQIICFSVLGLLTCLVILVTSGIVFFSRCETWMANTKYSQLVRQQRDQLLRASDLEQRSLNIILPENIRMSNYSRLYTSI